MSRRKRISSTFFLPQRGNCTLGRFFALLVLPNDRENFASWIKCVFTPESHSFIKMLLMFNPKKLLNQRAVSALVRKIFNVLSLFWLEETGFPWYLILIDTFSKIRPFLLYLLLSQRDFLLNLLFCQCLVHVMSLGSVISKEKCMVPNGSFRQSNII